MGVFVKCMKRRIFWVLTGIFVLALVLMFVQSLWFHSLTGFVVDSPSGEIGGSFENISEMIVDNPSGRIVEDEGVLGKNNPSEPLLVEVGDYSIIDERLKLDYSVTDSSSENHELVLDYDFKDVQGRELVYGNEKIVVEKDKKSYYILNFELPKDSFGEFILNLSFTESGKTVRILKKVYLPSKGVSGFVVSEENRNTLTNWGVWGLVIIGLILLWKFYFERMFFKKAEKKHGLGKRNDRRVIPLKLEEWEEN